MSDLITLNGIVGTTPNHVTTGTGMPMTTFRLASTQRRYDRTKQEWVDGEPKREIALQWFRPQN